VSGWLLVLLLMNPRVIQVMKRKEIMYKVAQ